MEIIMPIVIFQSVLSIIQITFSFFIEFIIFKNPFVSNIWLPGSLMYLQSFNGLCFGKYYLLKNIIWLYHID